MTRYTRHPHLRLAIGAALLSSLLLTSGALAQPLNAAALVHVEAPPNGSIVAGNVTFTGVAVDRSTGQPATRVAVYDGDPAQGIYLADVSMDTMRDLATLYPGGVGMAQVGWTLIFDSHRLFEGTHVLTFVAQFPNGTIAPTTHQIIVDNVAQTAAPSNGVVVWYNGGYWINGVYVGPGLESLYYDPVHGGYWVNGAWVGPAYQWDSPYHYPAPGYWINGTYYNPQTGQACTGGQCYFVTTGD
jgi:hypothetical protein